jgi:LemA protein
MDILTILWIILAIVITAFALYLLFIYNGLIRMRNRITNARAQIDVQLKRRNDLIPNLVETVKGYMKHERELFTEITKARTAIMKTESMAEKAKASDMLSRTLKSLFAVAENYPKLRASENFMQLQEELTGTENKIAYARQHYNDVVMDYNIKIQVFPNRFFAKRMDFKKEEMFEVPEEEKKPVKVKF